MEDNYLPIISGVNKGVRFGRNIYEGYQRGWGLQFGDLQQKIKTDKLYVEALKDCIDLTILSELNRMNIFLIIKFFLSQIPFGHIIEFGSYKGGNALFMAYLVKKLFSDNRKVFALDTFEGMPVTDKNIDAHNFGDFKDASYEELVSRKEKLKLDNLIIIKGRFEDTLENIIDKYKVFSLAHIDCDIYSSVYYSYNTIKNYMVSGGYIVLDDALYSSCLGATECVEKHIIREDGLFSEQVFPHYVFRYKPLE